MQSGDELIAIRLDETSTTLIKVCAFERSYLTVGKDEQGNSPRC